MSLPGLQVGDSSQAVQWQLLNAVKFGGAVLYVQFGVLQLRIIMYSSVYFNYVQFCTDRCSLVPYSSIQFL